jgi:hypothetical protein
MIKTTENNLAFFTQKQPILTTKPTKSRPRKHTLPNPKLTNPHHHRPSLTPSTSHNPRSKPNFTHLHTTSTPQSHFSTAHPPSKTPLLPHLSTTFLHSPNPNRQTPNQTHICIRLQKIHFYNPPKSPLLSTSQAISYPIPKSNLSSKNTQIPNPHPFTQKQIPTIIYSKRPTGGYFQLHRLTSPSIYPGVLQTTPRSNAPFPVPTPIYIYYFSRGCVSRP